MKTPSLVGFIVKMYQLTKEKILLKFDCRKYYKKASYILVKVIVQQKCNDAPLWKNRFNQM